jgi:hypothetical protein
MWTKFTKYSHHQKEEKGVLNEDNPVKANAILKDDIGESSAALVFVEEAIAVRF